jgi:ADP-ribosylglycohydrolase
LKKKSIHENINRNNSDFGQDSEQILLVVQSILENNGYFHQKDLKNRLSKQVNHNISPHSLLILLPSPQNNSPSPALVRAPLLGAVKFWDGTSVIENSIHSCQLTRSDPRCMISCLVVSILVAR